MNILEKIYLPNVIVIATALALLEIWFEQFRGGFQGDFYSPYWSKHADGKFVELLNKVAGKKYLNRYHVTMFCAILPALYAGEWIWLAFYGSLGWISSALFVSAVCFGVAAAEDFIYFVLIGFFAKGLLKGKDFDDGIMLLLRGEMEWHTDQKEILWGVKLPRSYFVALAIVLLLLVIEHLTAAYGL